MRRCYRRRRTRCGTCRICDKHPRRNLPPISRRTIGKRRWNIGFNLNGGVGCSHKKADCPSNPFFAIVAVMKLKDLKDLKLGAMHVATHRRQGKGREYVSHFLRRSYREGGKVKKETLPRSTASVWIAPKQGSVPRSGPALSRRNGASLSRCAIAQRRNSILLEPPIGF